MSPQMNIDEEYKIHEPRRGVPIRAISITQGDHIGGDVSICLSWWDGEFEQGHEHDKYGNKTYWNVTLASLRRVIDLVLLEETNA